MMKQYKNTISVVCILFCLFISSASASSFIRKFTDGFNTNLQRLKTEEEVSSGDYKVSALNTVKGLRTRAPSTYTLNMESYTRVLESTTDNYQTRPFSAGGYNWTLLVYPNGNKKDSGSGYLSLYVAVHSTTPIPAGKEVYADLRFYVYNKNENKYFTIQDTEVWRFNAYKTMWGFSQVIPVDTFKDPKNGYLYDGDHCEFGVDVTVPPLYEKSELFSFSNNLYNPKFTWTLQGFSTLYKTYYLSNTFTVANREFHIMLYPSGAYGAEGKYVSMYLTYLGRQSNGPYESVFVKAIFRVLNQRQLENVETNVEKWNVDPRYYTAGKSKMISLADLRNSSKGFLVKDALTVEVELKAISETKYFP